MSLIHSAVRAGIFDRAMDVCEDMLLEATWQVRNGAAQIRAYRLWKSRGRGR